MCSLAVKKGQIVRVDKEKYLNSINVSVFLLLILRYQLCFSLIEMLFGEISIIVSLCITRRSAGKIKKLSFLCYCPLFGD